MLVLAEELYHFAMWSVCTRDLVVDSYYVFRTKRHTRSVVLRIVLFLLHSAFLGRHGNSAVLPPKMLYLFDMLFHTCRLAWDAAVIMAAVGCPGNYFARITDRKPGGYDSDSVLVALISIAYHVTTLTMYYRRMDVAPTEKPSVRVSHCLSWLKNTFERRRAAMTAPPLLPDALELERARETEQIFQKSLDTSHRPSSSSTVKKRRKAPVATPAPMNDNEVEALN